MSKGDLMQICWKLLQNKEGNDNTFGLDRGVEPQEKKGTGGRKGLSITLHEEGGTPTNGSYERRRDIGQEKEKGERSRKGRKGNSKPRGKNSSSVERVVQDRYLKKALQHRGKEGSNDFLPLKRDISTKLTLSEGGLGAGKPDDIKGRLANWRECGMYRDKKR